jgi:hypothetical protein
VSDMVGHEACSSSWSFTMVRILWRFYVFCRHPTPSAPCMHAVSGWSSLRKTGCQPIVAHVVHAIIPSDTFVSDPAPYMVVEFAYQLIVMIIATALNDNNLSPPPQCEPQ